MAYKKEKTITVTSNLIPTCKDCVYFEKAWDEKSDCACNVYRGMMSFLTYPDEKACSAFEPKENQK